MHAKDYDPTSMMDVRPDVSEQNTPTLTINEHGVIIRVLPESFGGLMGAYACISVKGYGQLILSKDMQNRLPLPSTHLKIQCVPDEPPAPILYAGKCSVVFESCR